MPCAKLLKKSKKKKGAMSVHLKYHLLGKFLTRGMKKKQKTGCCLLNLGFVSLLEHSESPGTDTAGRIN